MTANTRYPHVVVVTAAQSAGRTTLLRHGLAELNLQPSEIRPSATEGQSSLSSGTAEVRS